MFCHQLDLSSHLDFFTPAAEQQSSGRQTWQAILPEYYNNGEMLSGQMEPIIADDCWTVWQEMRHGHADKQRSAQYTLNRLNYVHNSFFCLLFHNKLDFCKSFADFLNFYTNRTGDRYYLHNLKCKILNILETIAN